MLSVVVMLQLNDFERKYCKILSQKTHEKMTLGMRMEQRSVINLFVHFGENAN
jgi:hypothetical protein